MTQAAASVGEGRRLAGARLKDWTSFRLGGACRALYCCATAALAAETIRAVRRSGARAVLLGGGTNVLVSDAGIDAVVIRFADGPLRVARIGQTLEVEAGVALDALSAWCAEQGLAGLEFAAGIPGTVGGALAVNAGAFGRQMSDVLAWVETLDPTGRRVRLSPGDLGFSYRRCALACAGHCFLRAALRVKPGGADRIATARKKALAFRKEKHPDWRRTPCAGSFFRNLEPSSAVGRRQAAGWFLEQAGAAALQEGGARVYERHCNIIVADGPGVCARDVHRLSLRMASAVETMFQLKLEPEVRRIGRF